MYRIRIASSYHQEGLCTCSKRFNLVCFRSYILRVSFRLNKCSGLRSCVAHGLWWSKITKTKCSRPPSLFFPKLNFPIVSTQFGLSQWAWYHSPIQCWGLCWAFPPNQQPEVWAKELRRPIELSERWLTSTSFVWSLTARQIHLMKHFWEQIVSCIWYHADGQENGLENRSA